MDQKNKKNGKGNGHKWRSFKSLDDEIGAIELDMREHRAASTVHAAALESGLRDKISTPGALLAAAGAGFAAGYFGVFRKRDRAAEIRRDAERAEERAEEEFADRRRKRGRGIDSASLLNQIMQGLSLAGTIMAMLPKHDRARDSDEATEETGQPDSTVRPDGVSARQAPNNPA